MSASLDLTNAAAFRAYAEKHTNELFTKAMLSFDSAPHMTPHEGVKGTKVLNELIVQDLFRRYSVDFSALADAVSIDPQTISTVKAKIDMTIAPADFEESYLGFLRQTGQNPRDFPFQAYIIDKIMMKAAEEQELALWQGVAAGAPAATDKLIALFDGLLHQVEDAITATDITPYASGATNATNILAAVEAMYQSLGDQWKSGEVKAFMSWTKFQQLLQNYRNDVGKYTNPDMSGGFRLDFGNCVVIPCPGMRGKERIIVTTAMNPQHAYDAATDSTLINFEWNRRKMDMWMDIRMGASWLFLDDASGAIIVNDQT